MADTLFSQGTTIASTWLNVINNWVFQGKNPNYVTSTGAANTYTVTIPPTSLLSALVAGTEVTFKSHQANSGAATLTLVGSVSMGPTALQVGGNALAGAEIASGATVKVVYDGAVWQVVSVSAATGYLAKSGGTMTGDLTMSGASIIEAEGAAVTAAASCNIWATDGNTVHVTGNTGITDFGTAPQAGAWMKVIFDGTPVLTQSANLNLNAGGANVTIAAGDFAMVHAETTTQMDVFVVRASGQANIQPPGSVVQVANTTVSTRVVGAGTAIPADNSIPQITEGDLFITASAFTPTSATNKLKITVVFLGGEVTNTSSDLTVALFQDSTANALAAMYQEASIGVGTISPITFIHYMTAGTTSPTTFRVRAGLDTANPVEMNAKDGTQLYGGVCASSITIEEIQA